MMRQFGFTCAVDEVWEFDLSDCVWRDMHGQVVGFDLSGRWCDMLRRMAIETDAHNEAARNTSRVKARMAELTEQRRAEINAREREFEPLPEVGSERCSWGKWSDGIHALDDDGTCVRCGYNEELPWSLRPQAGEPREPLSSPAPTPPEHDRCKGASICAQHGWKGCHCENPQRPALVVPIVGFNPPVTKVVTRAPAPQHIEVQYVIRAKFRADTRAVDIAAYRLGKRFEKLMDPLDLSEGAAVDITMVQWEER